jgi:hypothetical protein
MKKAQFSTSLLTSHMKNGSTNKNTSPINMNCATFWRRDLSFGIATGYGLDIGGSIPETGKRYSIVHSVQSGPGAHPDSYPMGMGGLFPPGREADHTPQSTADDKNGGAIPPLSHTSS